MKFKLLALMALIAVSTNSFAIDIADRNDLVALEKRVDEISLSHTEMMLRTAERSQAAILTVVAKPDWVLNVPESDQAIFAVGVGVSNNEQRSVDKAILNAERRLIEVVNSEIETATRSSSVETGDDVQETFESITRKNAYGQLIGTMRVKAFQQLDGNKYRTYVLMSLPMDENNPIRKQREARQTKADAETRNRMAVDSLDQQLKERQQRDREAADQRQQNIRPLATEKVEPQVVVTPSTTTPLQSIVTLKQSLASGEEIIPDNAIITPDGAIIQPIADIGITETPVIDMSFQRKQALINKVQNEDVQQRIAQALAKSNAVVLSTTIR